MDAAQALADLTEISSQIEAAVLFDEGGAVLGSTLANERGGTGGRAGRRSSCWSARVRSAPRESITQLEASTGDGSVFVVRDGARRIAATTGTGADGRSRLLRLEERPAEHRRGSRRSRSERVERRRTMKRKFLAAARLCDRHLRRQRDLPPLVREAP